MIYELNISNQIALINNKEYFSKLLNNEQLILLNNIKNYLKECPNRLKKETDNIVKELIISNIIKSLKSSIINKELLNNEIVLLQSILVNYIHSHLKKEIIQDELMKTLITTNIILIADDIELIFPHQLTEYEHRIHNKIKKLTLE